MSKGWVIVLIVIAIVVVAAALYFVCRAWYRNDDGEDSGRDGGQERIGRLEENYRRLKKTVCDDSKKLTALDCTNKGMGSLIEKAIASINGSSLVSAVVYDPSTTATYATNAFVSLALLSSSESKYWTIVNGNAVKVPQPGKYQINWLVEFVPVASTSVTFAVDIGGQDADNGATTIEFGATLSTTLTFIMGTCDVFISNPTTDVIQLCNRGPSVQVVKSTLPSGVAIPPVKLSINLLGPLIVQQSPP